MKKLLLTTFLALPSITFAGGIGNIDLSDYNIVPISSTVKTSILNDTSLINSSEAPTPVATKTKKITHRRGYGLRLPSSGTSFIRTTPRERTTRVYKNYWTWVNKKRIQENKLMGATRTGTFNFGNHYELSVGFEPIDPKDNMYRGLVREDERQSAAQRKMMRIRDIQ
jgi:hypothetical protein